MVGLYMLGGLLPLFEVAIIDQNALVVKGLSSARRS
jgi:hypothetical protein